MDDYGIQPIELDHQRNALRVEVFHPSVRCYLRPNCWQGEWLREHRGKYHADNSPLMFAECVGGDAPCSECYRVTGYVNPLDLYSEVVLHAGCLVFIGNDDRTVFTVIGFSGNLVRLAYYREGVFQRQYTEAHKSLLVLYKSREQARAA